MKLYRKENLISFRYKETKKAYSRSDPTYCVDCYYPDTNNPHDVAVALRQLADQIDDRFPISAEVKDDWFLYPAMSYTRVREG